MIEGKKIIVVLPAYNAAKTLLATISNIPMNIVDELVLVDDASTDDTAGIAKMSDIQHVILHDRNKGYGANQKTCYQKALSLGADIIILLHPDYQYDPRLIPVMAHLIATNVYPVVLGSRILSKDAVKNGMPLYKYFFNRILTWIQNTMLNKKLSEYHTGYRAYSKTVLQSINFMENDDDFIFDNQILTQIFYQGYTIGEISCPARYFPEASSINFYRSIKYGLGVLHNTCIYLLHKRKIIASKLYKTNK